jgi:hypothetical protein
MATPTLDDMIDVYIISEAEMEAALLVAGNRGNNLLNGLAPYAVVPLTPPVLQGDYADTYTLADAAEVNSVLFPLGPRGFAVFENLLASAAA